VTSLRDSRWAPPLAFVLGIILLAVVAEISKPKQHDQGARGFALVPVTATASSPSRGMDPGVTQHGNRTAASSSPSRDRGALPFASIPAGAANGSKDAVAPRSVASEAIVEDVSLCPKYTGGWCYGTPHVRWQCGDKEVAALKATWSVYEVWCMDGAQEVRVPGAWTEPVSGPAIARMANAEAMSVVAPCPPCPMRSLTVLPNTARVTPPVIAGRSLYVGDAARARPRIERRSAAECSILAPGSVRYTQGGVTRTTGALFPCRPADRRWAYGTRSISIEYQDGAMATVLEAWPE